MDQPPVCTFCQGNHTANYRGFQVHKEHLHYGKTIPKTKISKPNVNYSKIVNEGGDSFTKTQRSPPNINDSTSFPNLIPHSPNHHYYKIAKILLLTTQQAILKLLCNYLPSITNLN